MLFEGNEFCTREVVGRNILNTVERDAITKVTWSEMRPIIYGVTQIPQSFYLPFPMKPRQALFAREELLHGSLFDAALLGDELVQRADQGIHIAKGRSDGLLFRFGPGERNL